MDDSPALNFEFEWEPAKGVTAAELQATWARLSILCGNESLTQVEDVASGSVRRSVYVPLYPMAEWIAYNWWYLTANARPSYLPERDWSFRSRLRMSENRSSWLMHHNLRAVGEGLPWPDITLIPMKETVIVAWQRDRNLVPGWRVRFMSTGRTEIDRSTFEQSLVAFVDAVLTRLEEEHVHETPLAQEWRELQNLDSEEVEFCAAAARLGLDPFATPPDVAELILESSAQLSATLLDDFLDAATPGRLKDEAEWVRALWKGIADSDRATDALPALSNGHSALQRRPWEKGLLDARQFRSAVEVPSIETFDVRRWVAVEHATRVSRSLQGLGARTAAGGRIVALVEPKSDEGERFAAARALWRFLSDVDSGEFLVTSARTPKQQAERAFAAELLAPATGVLEMLGPDSGDPIAADDIRPISQHFAVSDWVVQYQIMNQLGLDIEDLALGRDE